MLYPTSASCSKVSEELNARFAAYDSVMEQANNFELIAMNFFSNMGTVLASMVQLDDCFAAWDGTCAGYRLGLTTFTLLNPDVQAKWDALRNNQLI